MTGGLTKKERVTNVEITPENNTVGVSARGREVNSHAHYKPPSHPTVNPLLPGVW